ALAVSHIKRRPIGREAARLCKRCRAPRKKRRFGHEIAIDDVLAPVPGKRANFALVERHLPDLMAAGHGDEQLFLVNPQSPRAAERGRRRRADPAAWPFVSNGAAIPTGKWIRCLLTGPRDGGDLLRLEVNLSQQMIFRIRDIQRLTAQYATLRM